MQMSPYTPGEVAEEVYGREPILEGIRRDLAFMTIEPRFCRTDPGVRGPPWSGQDEFASRCASGC